VPASFSEIPDGMLVEAVLDGRNDYFAEIVTRYRSPLFRVASSRLSRADLAEDVVQETFLCAFKSLHSYDSRYSFRTWLWTILLNQCNRHLRKANRTPRVDAHGMLSIVQRQDVEERPSSQPNETPVGYVLNRERSQLVEHHLSSLPRTQADALRLRFYASLKFHEIADAMGCSLSTAKNRVRCGLTKMGSLMSDYEQRSCEVDRDSRATANREPLHKGN
jgi:RNA polymerase sigma-70 factor (ECF subfamily)